MTSFFFHLEVIVLEFFCAWLSLLMTSLFLSYRCTPNSRCSPIKMRITQYCVPALLLMIVRCVDPSTQLHRIPWHVVAIFSDQVTAVISHAAMLVLLASAKSLYTMIRRPMPRALPYLIFVPAIIYQLVAIAVGIANIWVLPDALSTRPVSKVMNMQAIRIFNFQVLMLFICVASWACVIGLRKQVGIYVVAIEKQEADRAANTAATLAAAAAAATATPAAGSVPSPTNAGAKLVPAPPAATSLRVVVIPSALTVGAPGGSISVPAPSASSGAYSTGAGVAQTATVAAVVSSAAINANAALQRLTDLKDAARKLRTLFILIQCVIWLGFGTNMSFLSYYLNGHVDPYYTDTDFSDNEHYKVSLAALPMYAIGHTAAIFVMVWYVWIDSSSWRKHLSEGGLIELIALVWRGAQEEGHTNQTRQSQPTGVAGAAVAGDRRVHPAPVGSTLGAKSAWANLEVSTAHGNAAAPAASSQKRLTGGERHSSKRGSGGNPYLVTSPTAAGSAQSAAASPAGPGAVAVTTPVDPEVGAADLGSGASSPQQHDGDDAVVLLYPSPASERETGNEGEEEA